MLLNLLVIIAGTLYWYFTGHSVPVFIGLIMLVSLYSDSLYFVSLLIAAVAISSIIYFFWVDLYSYKTGEEAFQKSIGAIYMIVLFIKAKTIFNADKSY